MGIDIDSFPFSLAEQLLQVFQVVAADEYSRAITHTDIDFCDFGVAVGLGIGFVEQGHHFDAAVAHSEHKREQFVDADVEPGRLGHGVFYNGIYVFILIAEVGCMTGVCGHTLAAVYCELLQAADVIVCLGKHSSEWLAVRRLIGLGVKLHLRQVGQGDALLLGGAGKQILYLESAADIIVERRIVEVGIGYGGKEGVDDKMACLARRLAFLTQSAVDERHASDGIQKQIHTGRSVGLLSADAHSFATCAVCRLLTLIAKHCRIFHLSVVFYRCVLLSGCYPINQYYKHDS